MRVLTYTIRLTVPEDVDLEASCVTFEQYIDDFNKASQEEWPLGPPQAEVKSIEN